MYENEHLINVDPIYCTRREQNNFLLLLFTI